MPDQESKLDSGQVATQSDPGEVPFVLDGRPVSAHKGEMLIAAAERAGVFIPRFCYHPRMKSVGVCRMCLVEVSGPRGATLQPACYVAATDGMEVVTDSEKVKKAQDGVLEFLLVNHPLDCPVCDKGGECPLQDQTVAYGPGESRFLEEKRHFEKPIAISELVLLDRERCIQCSRCTRFAEEVAGEALIDFAGRGEMVEVATFPDRPFSSYFSGNTVQICPVGALTATPYRFTARPWDLDQVESTCTTCALGCRVAVQSSANRLTRLLGIDSDPVNQGWLCDKGRFAFESVNGDPSEPGGSPAGHAEGGPNSATGELASTATTATAIATPTADIRITSPMVRIDGELVSVGWGEALKAAADGIARAKEDGGPESVAFLGGSRLTNEGAYAWAKLAKGVIGTDSVDAQLGDGLPADLVLSLPRATIDDACSAKVVVLLTGDVREELPVLFLRLRQAALDNKTSLVELAPHSTSLSSYAAASLPTPPGDCVAMAKALTGDSQALAAARSHPEGPAYSAEQLDKALTLIAEASAPGNGAPGEGARGEGGYGVVVLAGRASMAEDAAFSAEALSILAKAWPAAKFLPTLRRGNIHGAIDMGLAPGLLPGRVSLEEGRQWFTDAWGSVPRSTGRDAISILSSLANKSAPAQRASSKALVLLGVDLLGDFPDVSLAERAFSRAQFVVAVAGHHSSTADRADVVLPVAVAHERPGTFTNIEGRVTRLGQKLVPPGQAWADWIIASELAAELGADLKLSTLVEVTDEIERLAPAYRGLTSTVLDSIQAHDGILVPLDGPESKKNVSEVAKIDPIAIPGVDSVERQGAPPRVGLVEFEVHSEGSNGSRSNGSVLPPLLSGIPDSPSVLLPAPDSYSLRLVSTRKLYDNGASVTSSPSLTPLIAHAQARANPYDLARLGVDTGDPVRVRSARQTMTLLAEADDSVPRGVLVVQFNLPAVGIDESNVAAALIDVTAPVNDVRLESVR